MRGWGGSGVAARHGACEDLIRVFSSLLLMMMTTTVSPDTVTVRRDAYNLYDGGPYPCPFLPGQKYYAGSTRCPETINAFGIDLVLSIATLGFRNVPSLDGWRGRTTWRDGTPCSLSGLRFFDGLRV